MKNLCLPLASPFFLTMLSFWAVWSSFILPDTVLWKHSCHPIFFYRNLLFSHSEDKKDFCLRYLRTWYLLFTMAIFSFSLSFLTVQNAETKGNWVPILSHNGTELEDGLYREVFNALDLNVYMEFIYMEKRRY